MPGIVPHQQGTVPSHLSLRY